MKRKTIKSKTVCLFALFLLFIPIVSAICAAERPEIFVQLGHTGHVFSAAFSPDGKYIVSGGDDHAIKIWDAATGRELKNFSGHTWNVRSVAFSPDGKKIISASWDKSIKLWDIETGHEIRSFAGHDSMANAVAFSSDGRFALSGGIGKMKLWDIATGREVRTFAGHGDNVYAVALSPDGKYALSGSHDKTMRLWDVQTGRQIKSFNIHGDLVSAVAFSPDGKHALSGSFDGAIVLWDIASGKPRKAFTGHEYPISSAVFSPDGRYILSGSGDRTVRLWDVTSGKEIKKFTGHQGAVHCVNFSADGRYALSASADRTLILWDIASGREVKTFKGYANFVLCVALSPDGTFALSGDHGIATLRLWDLSSGRLVREFKGLAYGVAFAAFLPGGKSVLAGNVEGIFKIWNMDTGTEEKTFGGHKMVVDAIAISADGKKIISGDRNGLILLHDVVSGAKIGEFANQKYVNSLAFSPDGRYAAAGCDNNLLKVFNLVTGKEEITFKGHDRPVGTLAFSPDGKYLLSGSGDRTMKLWDITAGKEEKTFTGHMGTVNATVFFKDGKRIVSAGGDGRIIIWDVSSGRESKTLAGHFSYVSGLVLSTNGEHIVSVSWDGSLKVWDISSGREMVQLTGFSNGEWIIITPEGYYNSSQDGHRHLNIRQGMKVYGIDQFYDVFYRPDIVAAKLRGDDISSLITLTIYDAIKSPPPTVEFTTIPKDTDKAKTTVCYQVKSTGGGIGEVRLFHNGKLIQSDGYYKEIAGSASDKTQLASFNSRKIYDDMRSIRVKGSIDTSVISKSKGAVFETCTDVEAVPGDNEMSVTAFNKSNTVQSYMKTINFRSSLKPEEPHLYILSVGIDKYRDEKGNLKYAVKDAGDIEEKFLRQSKTIYKPNNIHHELLTNEQATKENITGRIETLSKTIRPSDGFIFFVAGHGVLLQNQYYMLTHDFDGTINDKSTISSNAIIEMSKKIKSLSQLFIFDTCHAGGVDTIVNGLYDARMSVLAKKMGLHIYASANSKEGAMDGYKGNGLFTYTLLDGLNNNKQADKYKDGKVSIVGLGEYTKKMTTNISKQIGHEQTPLIINFGKDSPLYKLQ
jgi:WD40 repeat protein